MVLQHWAVLNSAIFQVRGMPDVWLPIFFQDIPCDEDSALTNKQWSKVQNPRLLINKVLDSLSFNFVLFKKYSGWPVMCSSLDGDSLVKVALRIFTNQNDGRPRCGLALSRCRQWWRPYPLLPSSCSHTPNCSPCLCHGYQSRRSHWVLPDNPSIPVLTKPQSSTSYWLSTIPPAPAQQHYYLGRRHVARAGLLPRTIWHHDPNDCSFLCGWRQLQCRRRFF